MFPSDDEDRIANGLTGKACTRGTESDGQFQAVGQTEQLGHFVFAVRTDDYLRNEAVEASIRAPGQASQFVSIDPLLRDEAQGFVQER